MAQVVTIDPFRFDDVATEGESSEATEPVGEHPLIGIRMALILDVA